MDKTNVMRILEAKKITYSPYFYDCEITDGVGVAKALSQPTEQVFKTLVTISNSLSYFVFIVPVAQTLSLKKAAKAVNAKKIEMIKQKELFPLTGYIHGGCSPIGMKKPFVTVIDETAQLFDTIFFSAGKVGSQVEVSPKDLAELISIKFCDIIEN